MEPGGHVDVRNVFAQQSEGGIADSMATAPTGTFNPVPPSEQPTAEQGSPSEQSKPLSKEEFMAKVTDLKDLLEMGIIDQSDFDASKKELLQRFNRN